MFRMSLDSGKWDGEVYISSYDERKGVIEVRTEDGVWLGSLHGSEEDFKTLEALCGAILMEFEEERKERKRFREITQVGLTG